MPDSHTVTLGSNTVLIERPTGLKASRAIALMRALSQAMPELLNELATFRRDYERANVLELDRVQAMLRYPPRPILGDDGQILLTEDGQPRMLPSAVDRITDEQWEASGNIYRVPASPTTEEVIVAMFDRALEVAEEHVYALLALFTIPNQSLKDARRAGTINELISDRTAELLDDAFADELLELAVCVGETVDHHFVRKTKIMGDRLGNALRAFGVSPKTKTTPTPTNAPSSSKPSSSTDSPSSTPDGGPTSSSTPPTSSSLSSGDSASSTTPSAKPPKRSAAKAA